MAALSKSKFFPSPQKAREAVSFAYEKGGLSLVDLLEAERADNDARLAAAQAMADAASAAADLKASTEVMNSTEICP